MSEYDYDEKLKIFCEDRGIWNYDDERPTTFVINRLKTVVDKVYLDGHISYKQEQDGFTTKRIKLTHCRSCFKELEGKQKQYCSTNCKQNVVDLKKKFAELEKNNRELIGIIWTQNPDRKPEWKDVKGITNIDGIYKEEDNIITKKSGKTRNKDY